MFFLKNWGDVNKLIDAVEEEKKEGGAGEGRRPVLFRRKTSMMGRKVEEIAACFQMFEKDIFYW